MQRILLVLFLICIPSIVLSKNLNYLLDIKYKDFPKTSKERIVLYFVSPPLFYNITTDNNTLKISIDNTDLKNFYGNLKIPSVIIDSISVKQIKTNLFVRIIFKKKILEYSEIKSEKPPLLYIKVTTAPVEIPKIEKRTVKIIKKKDNATDNKTLKKTKQLPKLKPKPKPKPKYKPKPKVKEIVTKAQINKARNYYEQGLAYMTERKFAEAIAVFKSLIASTKKTNPYNVKAQFRLIDCYFFASIKRDSQEVFTIQNMYQQLIAKYPKSDEAPWAAFQMANCYKLLGFFEEAAGTYKFVTKYYPESIYTPKAFLELSIIYYNMKKYDTALKNFRTILLKYPDSIIALKAIYYTANSLYHLNMFEEAYKVYLEALKKDTSFIEKDPETLYNLGNTYFHKKNYLKAREYFLKLRTLFPKSSHFDLALLKIGESYIREKNFEPAIYVFKRVIDVSKNQDNIIIARMELADIGIKNIKDKELLKKYYKFLNPDTAYNYIIDNYPYHKLTQIAFSRIINYYLKEKKYGLAIKYIEKFFKQLPNSKIKANIRKKIKPSLVGYFNNLFAQKNYALIVYYFEKYRSILTKDLSPLKTFKKVYLSYKNLNLFSSAGKLLNKMLAKKPRDKEFIIEKIRNEIREKNYKIALKNIKKLKKIPPEIKFMEGECYEYFTNFSKALKIYFELLNKNFKSKGSLNFRIAETYRNSGSFKKAYVFYKVVTSNFTKTTIDSFFLKNSYFQKAHMKYLLQNFKDAVKEFKDFINLYPDDFKTDSAYYYIINSLYKTKKYDDALRFFEKVKADFKDKNIFKITEHLIDKIKWIKTLSL
jgi:TolA-binding protein